MAETEAKETMETQNQESNEPTEGQDEQNKPKDFEITHPPNVEDISTEKNGSLLKVVIKEGTGEEKPQKGDTVFVHYVGTLLDGTKFDSSRDRNEKFKFELGKGQVIKGWDVGVATMRKGESCQLICKPEYAYGKQGSQPKIQPNAVLIFEVELFDWRGEDLSPDDDGSICRSIKKKGEGYTTPNEDATVDVHLIGKYEDQVFEDRDVTFNVGEGCDLNVIEGIDIAIKKFKKGEQSVLTILPKYAFGKEGKAEWNIPADATVIYDVELKNFEKAKESWEMDENERLEQADISKTKGTNFFKAGNYKKAIHHYKKVVDFLDTEDRLEGGQRDKQKALLVASHLNQAMAYLKLENWLEASKSCDSALEKEPKNEKGLFRRGQARVHLQEYKKAIEDFQAVLEVDPNNKAAKNQIIIANQKLKNVKDKEKKTYGGMFEKFAQEDAKRKPETESKENGEKASEQNTGSEMDMST